MTTRPLYLLLLWLAVSSPLWAINYIVTNTNNSGAGSFRQAVLDANASPGADSVLFNIPGLAPHTISLASPVIVSGNNTVIDGTSQPANGYAGPSPKVVLQGPGSAEGIRITGDYIEVLGLFVRDFNYYGISVETTADFFVIGKCGKGNVISSNSYEGLSIYGANGKVQSNIFGLLPDGNTIDGNEYYGISFENNAHHNLIGGTQVCERNIISGNWYDGIGFGGNCQDGGNYNVIIGNYIGTDATGLLDRGNQYYGIGIRGGSSFNKIGGSTPDSANLIAYNDYGGIGIDGEWLGFCSSTNNENNAIGINNFGCNDGPGITLNTDFISGLTGNAGYAAPTVLTVTATTISGTAQPGDLVRVYYDDGPACPCQGGQYLGSAVANGSGAWSLSGSFSTSQVVIATAQATSGPGAGNTSEFSACSTPPPVCTALSVSNTSICPGETTILSTNVPAGQGTFVWSTGSTASSISVSSTGSYTVTVTQPTCPPASQVQSATITVSATPSLSVYLGPDTTYCDPASYTLDAGNPGATYLWSTGATTQTITTGVSGILAVEVSQAGFCSDSDTVIINVNPSPTVNLGPNQTVCQGSTPVLDAGNPGSTYAWSTGATTQTIVPATGSTGTTTYTVTVTNAFNCTATDAVDITVNPPLTVNLGPDLEACVGDAVNLNAGNPGATYVWSTGQTSQNIVANTATAGTSVYTVTVSQTGFCDGTDDVQVTVYANPVLNLGPDQTLCLGDPASLDAGNPGSTYAWSTGATTQVIAVPTATTGSTSYSVTVTDGNGCQATDAVLIAVLPPAGTDLGPDLAACADAPPTLSSGLTGGTYLWSTGATTPSIVPAASGTYWLRVTLPGTCPDADTLQVTLNPLPVVLSLTPNQTLCAGTPASFTINSPGNSFAWSGGGSGTTNTYTAPAPGGSLLISVVATTPQGCDTTLLRSLSAFNVPSLSLPATATLCPGSPLALAATATGTNLGSSISYLWNTGATTPGITVAQPGTYTVQASTICSSLSASVVVAQQVLSPIALSADTSALTIDVPIAMTASSPDGLSFSWAFGDGSLGSGSPVTHAYAQPGDYWVLVTGTSAQGCTRTDSLLLTILPPPGVLVPSAFRPGSELGNAVFKPIFLGPVTAYSIEIYNRWGDQVYTTSDPESGWDGTIDGTAAPEGVYVFSLKATVLGREFVQTGTVTLLR